MCHNRIATWRRNEAGSSSGNRMRGGWLAVSLVEPRLGTQVNDDLALTRQYDSIGAPNREEAPDGRYNRLFRRRGCSQGAGGSAVEPFCSAFGQAGTLADRVSVG